MLVCSNCWSRIRPYSPPKTTVSRFQTLWRKHMYMSCSPCFVAQRHSSKGMGERGGFSLSRVLITTALVPPLQHQFAAPPPPILHERLSVPAALPPGSPVPIPPPRRRRPPTRRHFLLPRYRGPPATVGAFGHQPAAGAIRVVALPGGHGNTAFGAPLARSTSALPSDGGGTAARPPPMRSASAPPGDGGRKAAIPKRLRSSLAPRGAADDTVASPTPGCSASSLPGGHRRPRRPAVAIWAAAVDGGGDCDAPDAAPG